MTLIEALERFATTIQRDICELTIGAKGSEVDLWPEAMTAAVSLAGCLDEARTDDDLIAGVRHFCALYDAGTFTDDQWVKESEAVMGALSAVVVKHSANRSNPI